MKKVGQHWKTERGTKVIKTGDSTGLILTWRKKRTLAQLKQKYAEKLAVPLIVKNDDFGDKVSIRQVVFLNATKDERDALMSSAGPEIEDLFDGRLWTDLHWVDATPYKTYKEHRFH